jgi:hypothetical protein
MAVGEYKWPQTLLAAGIGGFAAWCATILLNLLINAVSPVRIPLWSTAILALILITYWFTGSAEDRIESVLRRKRKIAGFAEDPSFPVDDPRRILSEHFYSLREADKWMGEQKAKGAINGSFTDVRVVDESGRVVYPAPYTSTRVKLSIAYVLAVVIVAAAVQWFVETVFPDKELSGSDARREVYRRFPFWASMILTWVLLAHAEMREMASKDR